MTRGLQYILFILLLAVSGATTATAENGAPVWEYVSQRDDNSTDTPDRADSHMEVEVVDGKLYISLEEPAKVQIFSILGQLITERRLKAGTTRLTLSQRGVYILKSGSTTRRINL